MKITLIAALVIVIAGAGFYFYQNNSIDALMGNRATEENANVDRHEDHEEDGHTHEGEIGGKLKVANFTGELEAVDTACFADGICSVTVDGKKIVTLIGWNRDEVGSVLGVNSFGDLESHIGEQVEVYAKDEGNGTYTLYGSAGFYVKLK